MCAFYALFIFAGLFNCFASRCERVNIFSNITKNKPFLLIMGVILAIQIFIIYCGGELFRSAPLSIRELFITFFIAFSVLIFDVEVYVFRAQKMPLFDNFCLVRR